MIGQESGGGAQETIIDPVPELGRPMAESFNESAVVELVVSYRRSDQQDEDKAAQRHGLYSGRSCTHEDGTPSRRFMDTEEQPTGSLFVLHWSWGRGILAIFPRMQLARKSLI